jgi:hypothetical protein
MRVFVKIVEIIEGKPFDPFDWAQSKQAQGRRWRVNCLPI